jgi:hypothetical protein
MLVNALYLGLNNEPLRPAMRYLSIHDTVPDLAQSRIFDPHLHSFNPLRHISYVRARELADALYTVYPQGDNTLTMKYGRQALLYAFTTTTRLDRIELPKDMPGAADATAMIHDILRSPILKSVFCPKRTDPGFSFNEESIILAKLDRKDIGEFDALVLGLFLLNRYKGQVVVNDLGFYGRDAHTSLIREKRLIAAVNYLDELPKKLRNAVLLIKDKYPANVLHEDAVLLAKFAGLIPGTNEFNDYIQDAMAPL